MKRHDYTMILLFISLFISFFPSHSKAQCNVSLNQNMPAVIKILGQPDWKQDGKDCWAYFNEGIEIIFQDSALYSVRYKLGCPSLPSPLTNAGVVLGDTTKKVYQNLGNLVDSDIGKFITDIYSDGKTYMYAVNFGKLTKSLENVLVRQGKMSVTCLKNNYKPTKSEYLKWYSIGCYIVDYLVFCLEDNKMGLNQIKISLHNKLGSIPNVDTRFNSFFNIPDLTENAIRRTALFRNQLIEISALVGRESGSRIPTLLLFDGLFVSGILKGVYDKEEYSEIAAINEITNHIKGRNMNRYAILDKRLQSDFNKLVAMLESKDYYKKDTYSIAEQINHYLRYLSYDN